MGENKRRVKTKTVSRLVGVGGGGGVGGVDCKYEDIF